MSGVMTFAVSAFASPSLALSASSATARTRSTVGCVRHAITRSGSCAEEEVADPRRQQTPEILRNGELLPGWRRARSLGDRASDLQREQRVAAGDRVDPKDVRAVELLAGPLAEQATDRLFRSGRTASRCTRASPRACAISTRADGESGPRRRDVTTCTGSSCNLRSRKVIAREDGASNHWMSSIAITTGPREEIARTTPSAASETAR